MKEFHTLEDFNFKDKTVLLRVDINCPLDKGTLNIINDSRVRSIVPTVRELMGKRAKIVILAHQSKKGKWDFIPMEQHSKRLSRHLNHPVRYVSDVMGDAAKDSIRSLGAGEVLLLDNVRALECETAKLDMNGHSEAVLVKELAPLIDYYVCDAFGAAHRSQCSLVGFPLKVPSASGRLMTKEIFALKAIFGEPRRPAIFVLGGAKFGDVSPMIDHVLGSNTADTVMLTGLAGNAFLSARGTDLGPGSMEFLKEEMTDENVAAAKDMLTKYGQRILLPTDIAVERGGKRVNVLTGDLPVPEAALDIGDDTIEKFKKVLASSRTSFMSGPAGLYEKAGFEIGTKELMTAMIDSKGQSVIGGGHTLGAADQFDMTDRFSYVSTAGGALETFLLGKELPAVEALRQSFRKF
ncbi:MAG: phosphoglycerate kinase [Methanomassiliicoccaceae archaeon]|jgi:phosphoglycerate kinase|nr:phosphoglycerate kinase [Methanomassiliicoccaceae archaeon]